MNIYLITSSSSYFYSTRVTKDFVLLSLATNRSCVSYCRRELKITYLDMLLQYRVVQVQALEIVLARQLLRLVADLAERVLRGGARQQLSATHQG